MSAARVTRTAPGGDRARPLWFRRLLRDEYVLYTALLAVIPLVVAIVERSTAEIAFVAVVTPILVGIEAGLGLVPSRRRPLTPLGWSFLRLAVPFVLVALMVDTVGGPVRPLASLYLPIVVAGAALGMRQAIALTVAGAAIYLAPELSNLGTRDAIALRGIAHAGVALLLALATRRLVGQAQRAGAQLRAAMVAERRRSRQIGAMEAVARILVAGGPRSSILERVLDVLVTRFGYRYVSIYLWDGEVLRCGAQRNYVDPPATIPAGQGIVGRAAQARQLVYLPDVARDPEYVPADSAVQSEICAPLTVEDELLGVLNVESSDPLDRTDRDLVSMLAARIATVLALGRDRQALAEREELFRSLHEFSETVSAGLDLDALAERITAAAQRVVPADLVAVTLLDRATGHYLIRANQPPAAHVVGSRIHPGEGLAGRAISERATVIDTGYRPDRYPRALRGHAGIDARVGAGVPLIRDGVVVGAITLGRTDPASLFRPIELEAMRLVADHAALAIANAFLHSEVQELAIRDPLTGLHNRRYFDETIDRMIARWRRDRLGGHHPLSVILFDLDHFGTFNRQHGHQVGDAVLRVFGEVLAARFRESDLVARIGGEEFVALLEGATLEDAVRVADGVREALGLRSVTGEDGAALGITVSAGCATLDDALPTREALMRAADVALFMAKRAGRDRVVAA
jgi:diguanylate cyclase (GGDEF)-like protein